MRTLHQGTDTPAATVTFTACEQERFVTDAVCALLAQKGIVLELLLSDDASNDGTQVKIQQACADYRGPHTVKFLRQKTRQAINHFSLLARLASCDFQIMAHADDIAEPDRCAELKAAADRTGATLVSSNATLMDAAGKLHGRFCRNFATGPLDLREMIANGSRRSMLGATLAWRREIYTGFPPLDGKYLPVGHDSLLCFRAALLGGAYYLDEPLVRYRWHDAQWTNEIGPDATLDTQRESQLGLWASLRRAMTRDLEHLLATKPGDPRAARWQEAQALVRTSSVRVWDEWIALRDDMHGRGLRCTWISRADFRQGQTGVRRRRLPLWAWQYWEIFKQVRWRLTGRR